MNRHNLIQNKENRCQSMLIDIHQYQAFQQKYRLHDGAFEQVENNPCLQL